MEDTQVSLKLLIDTSANKVLFAEAGKEFVDFLFHIMSLPVATVVSLLSVTDMVGCLGMLYKSIESLNTDYLQANLTKNTVLKPETTVNVPLLSLSAPTFQGNNFYKCRSSCNEYNTNTNEMYMTDDPGTHCPRCNSTMSTKMCYVASKGATGATTSSNPSKGYVKEVVTCMVLDNLEVKPMSTISGITLMNKFQVKEISSLLEKEVQVTLNEGVAILKASLSTKAVLSTVFLKKNI